MNSRTADPSALRAERVEYVAGHLLGHAAVLTRLLIRQVRPDVSRTEAGVLRTLTEAPRRITELAELEGLAQPTMTLLVQRLEQRGWIRRERHPDDGRVVLVSLTDAGERTSGHSAHKSSPPCGASSTRCQTRRSPSSKRRPRRSAHSSTPSKIRAS